MRSYRRTASGATTIDSFVAMPSAHEAIETTCHLSGRVARPGADRAVERQQEEQPHHRFGSLRDVLDRFAEERMQRATPSADDHRDCVRAFTVLNVRLNAGR